MSRERLARVLLLPLVVAILVGALLAPWHTPFCVDNRTYLEMVDGVAKHGLPYTTNGPVDRFPELQARWNQWRNGRLWGSYLPVYPYMVAPVYLLGGARAVTQLNIALLVVLALGVFLLARKVARDPLAGTAAAYLVLGATHVWTFTFDVSPYTVMITASTWSVLCALEALEASGHRGDRFALAAGVLAGIAAGSHGLAFPMMLATVLSIAVVRAENETPLSLVRWLDGWCADRLPSRGSLRRAVFAIAGVAVVLLPVGLLNHVRFGTWSPLSTGACVWRSCMQTRLDQQGIGAMVRYNAPLFVWAAVTLSVLAVVGRSRRAVLLVLTVSLLVLTVPSTLHERAAGVARLLVAFVADTSTLDSLGFGFWKPSDGVGNFLGPYVIKSLLQSAPVLGLALLARGRCARERRAVLMLTLPCLALLASLVMRNNIALAHALGFPWLNLRYVTPMLPLLGVLTIVTVRDLPWRPMHLALVAVAALALGWWLHRMPNDVPEPRRLFLLRGSLVLAAMAFVLCARARVDPRRLASRVAVWGVVLTLGYGFAVNLGIDLRVWIQARSDHDTVPVRVGAVTPQRFALIGLAGPAGIDAALALRTSRDIEYADIEEVGQFEGFRRLIDYWSDQGRPIYAVMPSGTHSPWPDVRMELVEPTVPLFRLTRVR